MKVLVLNAGSSSMKFTLFSMGKEQVLAKGLVERLGSDKPNLIYKRADGYKVEEQIKATNAVEALQDICAKLTDKSYGVISDMSEIQAFGHRVVHGGEKVTAPVLVDEDIKKVIQDCILLAPLHNPANLAGIEACEKNFAGVPNVAVFDTAFHQTMPAEAFLYAIPYELYKEHGIRKYGFHGTSHRYVMNATAEFLGKDAKDLKIITCHLGNGCSMAAIENGKVVDTTMGLTPLEGLMMGTRSGDLDPAVVLTLGSLGKSGKEIDKILNKESGLWGVSGLNTFDMRDITAAEKDGHERATLARKMFTRRVVKYIGSYYAVLGGADVIVFTGGIGEFGNYIREKVCEALGAFGVELDKEANDEMFGKAGLISKENSKIKLLVMPTDEELMIARSVLSLVKK